MPLNLADNAAIVNVSSGAVRYVATGSYPYGAAITPDGRTGLVSNEASGTVSFIDLAAGTKLGDVDLGHLSHPEAIAIDPSGARAYVAVANADRVAVLDVAAQAQVSSLSTARPAAGDGTSPVALDLNPRGDRLLVAESGADELSVFDTGSGSLLGRIPTAAYPTDVRVTPDGRTLLWISSKGLGTGQNLNGPNPFETTDANTNSFEYLPLITFGKSGVLRFPGDDELPALTATADAQLRPSNAQAAPAGTPLRANGPIQHVFYVVKENRTYDQILRCCGSRSMEPTRRLLSPARMPRPSSRVTTNYP